MQSLKPLQTVHKFYFLEYFYVLLKSVELYKNRNQAFDHFKVLKQRYQLGESKYRKLSLELNDLSDAQESRYVYTFQSVIEEAAEYELITVEPPENLVLTEQGTKLIDEYESQGQRIFYSSLFGLMETRYNAFRYLVEFLYKSNQHRGGLLIFPSYSPRQLRFDRKSVTKVSDIIKYSESLVIKIEEDIRHHLQKEQSLRAFRKSLTRPVFLS